LRSIDDGLRGGKRETAAKRARLRQRGAFPRREQTERPLDREPQRRVPRRSISVRGVELADAVA
jgi:hypothetical protein